MMSSFSARRDAASAKRRSSCGGWIRTTVIRFQGPALLPLNYPAMSFLRTALAGPCERYTKIISVSGRS